jgi:predicted lipoprotein with Yx(FWY)xxD motif
MDLSPRVAFAQAAHARTTLFNVSASSMCTPKEELMQYPRLVIAVFVVVIAATIGEVAITPGRSSSSSAAAAANGAAAVLGGPVSQATVQTAAVQVQGKTETILVDAHGLPLYIYKPDTATTSHVRGHLAGLWPPLVAATPTASGVTGGVASIATTNGQQVAYNGHFLYTFVADSRGRVTGQGVQNFFVATPALSAGASSAVNVAPSPSSNGYGY